MSYSELLSTLQTLSRADKLKIMQFLVQELAAEEEALLLQPGATYAVWSPYNSHDATQKLATLLEEDKQSNNVWFSDVFLSLEFSPKGFLEKGVKELIHLLMLIY